MRSGDRQVRLLCRLMQWVFLVATPAYRIKVWSTWWVDPYAETCSSIYDDSEIEAFANGDAERAGFLPQQVGALRVFLEAMDRLTETHIPNVALSEAVVLTAEWGAAVLSAANLIAEGRSWTDRFCCDEYDRVPLRRFEE